MGHFGQELREERESRGIALESITGVTKISGRHLLALEQEKFDALPGGVLSKGIVRGYVRAVGLDEDAWMSRYLSAYHQSGQLKDDDMSWMEFAENVGRSRKGDLPRPMQAMRWAGVIVLLTLLALFSWYVARFVNERGALAAEDLRAPVATLTTEAAGTAQPVRAAAHHAAVHGAGVRPDSADAGAVVARGSVVGFTTAPVVPVAIDPGQLKAVPSSPASVPPTSETEPQG